MHTFAKLKNARISPQKCRLVADVVTGKLDVREAAARLPDGAASDQTDDGSGVDADLEVADEEAGGE